MNKHVLRTGNKVSEKEEGVWITAASAVPGKCCRTLGGLICNFFITLQAKTAHLDLPFLLCQILFLQMYECKFKEKK